MKLYQEIIGYAGVLVALVCWLMVIISGKQKLGPVNIQWIGYMTAWGCLIFVLISARVDGA